MERQPHLARNFEKRRNLKNNFIKLEELYGYISFFPSENELDVVFRNLRNQKLGKVILKYNKNNIFVCYGIDNRQNSIKNIIKTIDKFVSEQIKKISPTFFNGEIKTNFTLCFIDSFNLAFNSNIHYKTCCHYFNCCFQSQGFIKSDRITKYYEYLRNVFTEGSYEYLNINFTNLSELLHIHKYKNFIQKIDYKGEFLSYIIYYNDKFIEQNIISKCLEKEDYLTLTKKIFKKVNNNTKKKCFHSLKDIKTFQSLFFIKEIVNLFKIKNIDIIYQIYKILTNTENLKLNQTSNHDYYSILKVSIDFLKNLKNYHKTLDDYKVVNWLNKLLLKENINFNNKTITIRHVNYLFNTLDEFYFEENLYESLEIEKIKSLNELHDYLKYHVNHLNHKNRSLKTDSNEYYYNILENYVDKTELSYGKIKLPKDTHELLDVAQKLKNCIYGHKDEIRSCSRVFILYIINFENEIIQCLEIELIFDELKILEFKAKFNKKVELLNKQEVYSKLNRKLKGENNE